MLVTLPSCGSTRLGSPRTSYVSLKQPNRCRRSFSDRCLSSHSGVTGRSMLCHRTLRSVSVKVTGGHLGDSYIPLRLNIWKASRPCTLAWRSMSIASGSLRQDQLRRVQLPVRQNTGFEGLCFHQRRNIYSGVEQTYSDDAEFHSSRRRQVLKPTLEAATRERPYTSWLRSLAASLPPQKLPSQKERIVVQTIIFQRASSSSCREEASCCRSTE